MGSFSSANRHDDVIIVAQHRVLSQYLGALDVHGRGHVAHGFGVVVQFPLALFGQLCPVENIWPCFPPLVPFS